MGGGGVRWTGDRVGLVVGWGRGMCTADLVSQEERVQENTVLLYRWPR